MSSETLPDVRVSVQAGDFDAGAELTALTAGRAGIGAVASFIGLVRDEGGGNRVSAMTLEHYPGMVEKVLDEIVMSTLQRWSLQAVRIIHRYGRLLPGERIVFVAAASAHRSDAFSACEFMMDVLKTQAPFWKKEEGTHGAQWVDARESDHAALARWETGY